LDPDNLKNDILKLDEQRRRNLSPNLVQFGIPGVTKIRMGKIEAIGYSGGFLERATEIEPTDFISDISK
jgi:hypothetical protein